MWDSWKFYKVFRANNTLLPNLFFPDFWLLFDSSVAPVRHLQKRNIQTSIFLSLKLSQFSTVT